LILHAAPEPAATIGALPVAMIQPPFDAPLMPPAGDAMLPAPGRPSTLRAAIALAVIAAGANPEQISTVSVAAKP